jgi:hypothetical protein
MPLRRDNADDPRVGHDLDVLAQTYATDVATAVALDEPEAPPARARRGWRRDNADDPRVVADLETLAAHDAGTLPPSEPVTDADEDPLRDPFVRRFVDGALHVRGHAKYYGLLVAWLLLMFVLVPITRHDDASSSIDTDVAAAATAPEAAAAPSTTSTSTAPTVAVGTEPQLVAAQYEAPPVAATADAPSTTSPSAAPSDSATTTMAPRPLSIVRSGYASSTSGTPLEQDPGDGALPVAAAGSQPSKRSFVVLDGTASVLHLAVVDGAMGADAAGIAACPITERGWSAERAQPMPGPAFATTCITGVRQDDGTWTFDLGSITAATSANGWALTPMAGTFDLAFAGKTLP